MAKAVRAALDHAAVAPLVQTLLRTLRTMAEEDLAKPDGTLRHGIEGVLASLADQLRRDEFRERVTRGVEDAFLKAVPSWREAIKGFVVDTLRGQDVEAFTRRLELRVGKDLQYIRVNGTLLGALIGGVLYGLNTFLS